MSRTKRWGVEETKRRIQDSAIKALNRKEYHECLMDEIAVSTGIAKGTIYLYFHSKKDLYAALMVRMINDMKALVDEVHAEDLQPIRKLRVLLQRLHGFIGAHSHALLILREQTKPSRGKAQEKVQKAFEDLFHGMSLIVENGIYTKEIKSYPSTLVSALFFSALIVAARFKVKKCLSTYDISIDTIADILLHGIAAKGKTS